METEYQSPMHYDLLCQRSQLEYLRWSFHLVIHRNKVRDTTSLFLKQNFLLPYRWSCLRLFMQNTNIIHCQGLIIVESIKTTFMEDVSTRVHEKIKNIYDGKTDKWSDVSRHIIAYVKTQKIRYTIHYVKPTAQLLFKIWFPKGGPTCRRQVVNPRHQTPQVQSVAKPETPLHDIQVE